MICTKDKNEEYLHSGKKMHAISSQKFHDFVAIGMFMTLAAVVKHDGINKARNVEHVKFRKS